MAIKIPDINDKYIPLLLEKIGTKNTPMILKVQPEKDSKILDCFIIVEKKVDNCGGRRILGWQFWESDNLIEAEFHAVWESETKELIDITPKELPGINETLFVIDERLIYEEKQKDNFRINKTDNKLVDDFIAICQAIFKFENAGERAYQYELKLSESEKRKYQELKMLKDIYLYMISVKANKNSPCPCRSGKKFKNCHGQDLKIKLIGFNTKT